VRGSDLTSVPPSVGHRVLSLTPGRFPLVNSTPACSRAARIAAGVSEFLAVISLTLRAGLEEMLLASTIPIEEIIGSGGGRRRALSASAMP
jgi:hypothetical protein